MTVSGRLKNVKPPFSQPDCGWDAFAERWVSGPWRSLPWCPRPTAQEGLPLASLPGSLRGGALRGGGPRMRRSILAEPFLVYAGAVGEGLQRDIGLGIADLRDDDGVRRGVD